MAVDRSSRRSSDSIRDEKEGESIVVEGVRFTADEVWKVEIERNGKRITIERSDPQRRLGFLTID